MGLNLPLGSSENVEEYSTANGIHRLLFREFAEEVVIVDNLPMPYKHANQRLFIPQAGPWENFRSNEFIEKHKNLREDNDHFEININNENHITVKFINIPSRLNFMGINNEEVHTLEGVFTIINPLEFGIEVVIPVTFEMDDKNYIIDGEIWEVANDLVRQPVVLISWDLLQKIYNNSNNNSIGEHLIEDPYSDGKRLKEISSDDFWVFLSDMYFKVMRLHRLGANIARNIGDKIIEKYININNIHNINDMVKYGEDIIKSLMDEPIKLETDDRNKIIVNVNKSLIDLVKKGKVFYEETKKVIDNINNKDLKNYMFLFQWLINYIPTFRIIDIIQQSDSTVKITKEISIKISYKNKDDNYEKKDIIKFDQLFTFCPTTWKVIELALKYGINVNVLENNYV